MVAKSKMDNRKVEYNSEKEEWIYSDNGEVCNMGKLFKESVRGHKDRFIWIRKKGRPSIEEIEQTVNLFGGFIKKYDIITTTDDTRIVGIYNEGKFSYFDDSTNDNSVSAENIETKVCYFLFGYFLAIIILVLFKILL